MKVVKKTFFADGDSNPSYILENGGTKRPYKIGERVVYFTNNEIATYEKENFIPQQEEENKKKSTYTFNQWLRKKIGWIIILPFLFAGCTPEVCKKCTTTITTTSGTYNDVSTSESYVCGDDIRQLKDMDGNTTQVQGGVTIKQNIKTYCK